MHKYERSKDYNNSEFKILEVHSMQLLFQFWSFNKMLYFTFLQIIRDLVLNLWGLYLLEQDLYFANKKTAHGHQKGKRSIFVFAQIYFRDANIKFMSCFENRTYFNSKLFLGYNDWSKTNREEFLEEKNYHE